MEALAADPVGYRHEAVVYHGDDGFVAAIAPFLREGVERGEPTLVAVVQPKIDLLRRALGPKDAAHVEFLDMAELGRNPAHIIPAWVDFVAAHSDEGRPLWGVGEPIWAGRRPEEVIESQLHEALLNVAVDPNTPFQLRCPYDALALEPAVIDEALRSHPTDDAGDAHAGRAGHLLELFAADLPSPPATAMSLPFSSDDLRPVRDAVRRTATVALLPFDRTDDLVLAVHEIAANSVVYGGGSGVLRTWDTPDAFVLEIVDGGHIRQPLAGRLPPDLADTGGRGLWLAHRMCDLVQVRSSERGTTVRISTWRERQRP